MSVSPAQSERQMGEGAYLLCARYRMAALVVSGLTVVNFFVPQFTFQKLDGSSLQLALMGVFYFCPAARSASSGVRDHWNSRFGE